MLKPRYSVTVELQVPKGGTLKFEEVAPEVTVTLTPFFTGAVGRSAYDDAVLTGFVGTKLEWLASLRGEAHISSDAENQLTQGSDSKLFVPRAQAVADPLAYYILASN